jgi:hypothetical protein
VAIGYLILQPPGDLITHAEFSNSTLSPNADGQDDITVFSYGISRNATVSLRFEQKTSSGEGLVFDFRADKRRTKGDYSVQFSGVVDGYVLAGEEVAGTIERRLMPDGQYIWTLEAVAEDGETETRSGNLTLTEGDTALPRISSFEVSSDQFTPNQDGVRDRVRVNLFLEKAADLQVYLEDEVGVKHFLSERLLGREPGEEGSHEYDYDGGVDNGFEPPPDGDYALFAVAQDKEGQRIVRTEQITIQDGGLPQMEIIAQPSGATVCFSRMPWDDKYYTDISEIGEKIPLPDQTCSDRSTLTLEQGDLLVFTLTVRNYGRTPVRTQGPFPGTVYDFNQQANGLGYLEKDGVFRVGIACDTVITSDFPWRWAIGDLDTLTIVEDEQLGDTFYYLDDNEDQSAQAVVWGAIRMTEIFEARNPQNCWAGLIHEGVAVDPFQRNVGRRQIKLVPPAEEQMQDEISASTPIFGS